MIKQRHVPDRLKVFSSGEVVGISWSSYWDCADRPEWGRMYAVALPRVAVGAWILFVVEGHRDRKARSGVDL